MGRRAAVSSVIGCSERANNHVVPSGIARGRFAGHFNRHLATVVRRGGIIHRHLVVALNRVVGGHEGEFRSSGVLDGDGLGGRSTVSSVVRRSEGAHDGVVASSIASGRFARHFNGHLTAVVRRRGIIHRHLVVALDGVVGGHESEFRSSGVLDGDCLRGRSTVSSVVRRSEGAHDGVVARGIAGSRFA